jgi:hypothetical protein
VNWHRLFGLLLTDYFTGSPFVVELERDLSHQQQRLDVLILRKRKGRFAGRLPDGLNDLVAHNLLTFKSHQEALTDWALKELTSHYVSYRKLLSSNEEPLLPESAFRLYAVCSRFPHNLAQEVAWERVQEGVYRCCRGTDAITVIVTGQLPRTEHNAPLHLFSASAEQVGYGVDHFRQRSATTSSLLYQLFEGYQREGIVMPYTMEEFLREFGLEHMKDFTPQERLKGLTVDEIVEALKPEVIDQLRDKLGDRPPDQPKRRRRKK